MNAVTKNKLSFLLRTADLNKEQIEINNKRAYKCSVTITGLYRTTYSRYRDFIKETLNKRYGTYTHVLSKEIKYNQTDENVCVVEFMLLPPGINP